MHGKIYGTLKSLIAPLPNCFSGVLGFLIFSCLCLAVFLCFPLLFSGNSRNNFLKPGVPASTAPISEGDLLDYAAEFPGSILQNTTGWRKVALSTVFLTGTHTHKRRVPSAAGHPFQDELRAAS